MPLKNETRTVVINFPFHALLPILHSKETAAPIAVPIRQKYYGNSSFKSY
jgi:hypothetical protein